MEYYDQLFDKTNYASISLDDALFEQCHFTGIDFTGTDLSGASFTDCVFQQCNLQMQPMNNILLGGVQFSNCKLNGIDFTHCNSFRFDVHFTGCLLDYTYFFEKNMKKAKLVDCSIRQAQFVQCDLSNALFQNCDLEQTMFDHNNLQGADFTTSVNLRLDPETNKIRKAKFSLYNLPGLLAKYDIVVK